MPLDRHRYAVCLAPCPLVHFKGGSPGNFFPSSIRSFIVLKSGFDLTPGTGSRNIRLWGMPTALAAVRAFSSSGTQVKSALAPEMRNWCSSSWDEYAALAGVAMPERRWMAYVHGRKSILGEKTRSANGFYILPAALTHRVDRVQGHDLVPLRLLAWTKAQALPNGASQMINPLSDLHGVVRRARDAACVRVS